MLFRQFLDEIPSENWMLVCFEHLSNAFAQKVDDTAREVLIYKLGRFLGYQNKNCDDCFDEFVDSTKDSLDEIGRAASYVGDKTIMEELDAVSSQLAGVWPPPFKNGHGLQCSL